MKNTAIKKPPNAGNGRPKGALNKTTQDIKAMLLASLDAVGGQAYFEEQAIKNPTAYMTLIGKIMPTTVNNNIKQEPSELKITVTRASRGNQTESN